MASKNCYDGVISSISQISSQDDSLPCPIEMDQKSISAKFEIGAKVTFKIIENKKTETKTATAVKLFVRPVTNGTGNHAQPEETSIDDLTLRGTVILKKDSYGFIESECHTKETFFHYSELSVKAEDITVSW